ncbi:hypothetical protein DPMN_052992 [Dreissena polymorpha]|uniref:Uncharacterized protein n=1 Tax=Dreissena polymorpha TaxID=45954 RepID=A0A9D4CLS9_DREPO|nr:hypothetical protein DPMN_052992 [Dreissena polymorpha]
MKCDFYSVYNFELDRDFIGTKLLTKFHEDRTINVASRVFTNKCGGTDRQRTKTGHRSSPEQSGWMNHLKSPSYFSPSYQLLTPSNLQSPHNSCNSAISVCQPYFTWPGLLPIFIQEMSVISHQEMSAISHLARPSPNIHTGNVSHISPGQACSQFHPGNVSHISTGQACSQYSSRNCQPYLNRPGLLPIFIQEMSAISQQARPAPNIHPGNVSHISTGQACSQYSSRKCEPYLNRPGLLPIFIQEMSAISQQARPAPNIHPGNVSHISTGQACSQYSSRKCEPYLNRPGLLPIFIQEISAISHLAMSAISHQARPAPNIHPGNVSHISPGQAGSQYSSRKCQPYLTWPGLLPIFIQEMSAISHLASSQYSSRKCQPYLTWPGLLPIFIQEMPAPDIHPGNVIHILPGQACSQYSSRKCLLPIFIQEMSAPNIHLGNACSQYSSRKSQARGTKMVPWPTA